jgi:hypothetical protein
VVSCVLDGKDDSYILKVLEKALNEIGA